MTCRPDRVMLAFVSHGPDSALLSGLDTLSGLQGDLLDQAVSLCLSESRKASAMSDLDLEMRELGSGLRDVFVSTGTSPSRLTGDYLKDLAHWWSGNKQNDDRDPVKTYLSSLR